MAALEASHIKPWADSNDSERLDPNNGLLLTASLHKLFDAGLISFEDSGKMLVSSKLSQSEREIKPASNNLCRLAVRRSPLLGSSLSLSFESAHDFMCDASSAAIVIESVTAQR